MQHITQYQSSSLNMSRNPTEEDIRLMLKTYAIINQIASPEELRIIAFETQNQSQHRYANAGREPSVAPSYIKRPRTPSRATAGNLRISRVQTTLEPHSLNGAGSKNPLPSQPIVMGTSRARSPLSVVPQPPKRAVINGHKNASVCHMSSCLICDLSLTRDRIFIQ